MASDTSAYRLLGDELRRLRENTPFLAYQLQAHPSTLIPRVRSASADWIPWVRGGEVPTAIASLGRASRRSSPPGRMRRPTIVSSLLTPLQPTRAPSQDLGNALQAVVS